MAERDGVGDLPEEPHLYGAAEAKAYIPPQRLDAKKKPAPSHPGEKKVAIREGVDPRRMPTMRNLQRPEALPPWLAEAAAAPQRARRRPAPTQLNSPGELGAPRELAAPHDLAPPREEALTRDLTPASASPADVPTAASSSGEHVSVDWTNVPSADQLGSATRAPSGLASATPLGAGRAGLTSTGSPWHTHATVDQTALPSANLLNTGQPPPAPISSVPAPLSAPAGRGRVVTTVLLAILALALVGVAAYLVVTSPKAGRDADAPIEVEAGSEQHEYDAPAGSASATAKPRPWPRRPKPTAPPKKVPHELDVYE